MTPDSATPQEPSGEPARSLIRTCRQASGLTQVELAEQVGLSASTISLYETGQQTPPIEVLRKIIVATGHSPSASSGSLAMNTAKESENIEWARPGIGSNEKQETSEAETLRLRARVEEHLVSQGFQISNGRLLAPVAQNKDHLRKLHSEAVGALRERARDSLARHEDRFIAGLALGSEIVPERIQPALVPVVTSRSFEGLMWRWCSLHWSVPVSSGYGRRLRFLVVDRGHNDRVMGLIGLADPVFALACRDAAIGWNAKWRKERLPSVMDAFVLGAVPPYSALCGGKLIALLTTCGEIREAFATRYTGRVSLISRRPLDTRLALVTTSSALGRSSVYNRLTFPDKTLAFKPVGYTSGSGDFHFSGRIYRELTDYAARHMSDNNTQRHERWTGSTFRNRREVIQRALDGLGYDSRQLRIHGIRRQVFLAPLAANSLSWLSGKSESLDWSTLDCDALGAWWLERWAIRRAGRSPTWRFFDPDSWRLYA